MFKVKGILFLVDSQTQSLSATVRLTGTSVPSRPKQNSISPKLAPQGTKQENSWEEMSFHFHSDATSHLASLPERRHLTGEFKIVYFFSQKFLKAFLCLSLFFIIITVLNLENRKEKKITASPGTQREFLLTFWCDSFPMDFNVVLLVMHMQFLAFLFHLTLCKQPLHGSGTVFICVFNRAACYSIK